MLRIYRTEEDGRLTKLKKNKILPMTWCSLVNPNEEELLQVSTVLHVDYDLLSNSLDADERSRIEQEKNSLAIIINLPLLDDEGNFDTLPCGLVITPKNFITICARDNRVMNSFNRSTAKTFDTRDRARFMLNILYKCTQFYLKYLNIINKRTDELEYALRKTTSNKELFQLMEIQKSMVYFTTALKDNHLVLLKLLRLMRTPAVAKLAGFGNDDADLLDDVIIENKQAIEMVDMHRSILEGMMDGFASIINNNVNLVMKFLAAITIILSIPTMLASFWGMNVPVAFAGDPNGFWLVMGISAIATVMTGFSSSRHCLYRWHLPVRQLSNTLHRLSHLLSAPCPPLPSYTSLPRLPRTPVPAVPPALCGSFSALCGSVSTLCGDNTAPVRPTRGTTGSLSHR